MKIDDLLKKPLWRRRVSRQQQVKSSMGTYINNNLMEAMEFDRGKDRLMSQTDFMDELNAESHMIHNVNYRSNRPKLKYNKETEQNDVIGFEDVERVSIALQESLRRTKSVCTFGNDIWIGNEGTEEQTDEIINLKSHWNMAGMQKALLQFARSAFGTGDSAIYLYRDGNRVNYKIFSFEDGDVIAENIHPVTKERVFVRMYNKDDIQAVEIYGTKYVEIWAKESDRSKLAKWWGQNITKTISEDGYTLVKRELHGSDECPVVYHREKDVCWGEGQTIIERIEKILSDLAENNRYYAFQMLFLTGGLLQLPDVGWQGKVLGSKSDDGTAKVLEPADCSNSFTLDLDTNTKLLYEVTSTTVVTPEDLKGGDYSGAYIRNLYFRDVQWTTEASARLDPFMKKLLSIFASLVGKIEGDITKYENLRLSYKIIPYLPQNELEEITILTMAVNSGFMSIETATEESPRSNPEEMKRIRAELAERDEREKAKEEVKVNDGKEDINSILKIDNRAKGKNFEGE